MRPGTYVPTDPLEIHAFAMEDLRVRWEKFSRNIARFEKAYEQLGIEYHKVPMTVRRVLSTKPNPAFVKAALEVRTGEDDEADQIPRLLADLKMLRERRDAVKAALRNQDVALASQSLEPGEIAVKDARAQVMILQETAKATWFSHEALALARNLPPLDGDVEEQKAACLKWLSHLPGIVKGLELGTYEDLRHAGCVLIASANEDQFEESDNEQDYPEDGEEDDVEEVVRAGY